MEPVELGSSVIITQMADLLKKMHQSYPQIVTSVVGTADGLPVYGFSSNQPPDEMTELTVAAFTAHIYLLSEKIIKTLTSTEVNWVVIYSTKHKIICSSVGAETLLTVVTASSDPAFSPSLIGYQKPVIVSTEIGMPANDFYIEPTVNELELAALTASLKMLGEKIIQDLTDSDEELVQIQIYSNFSRVVCSTLEGNTFTFVCSDRIKTDTIGSSVRHTTKLLSDLMRLQDWIWDAHLSHPLLKRLDSTSLLILFMLFCPLCGAQGLIQGQENQSEKIRLLCPKCENMLC